MRRLENWPSEGARECKLDEARKQPRKQRFLGASPRYLVDKAFSLRCSALPTSFRGAYQEGCTLNGADTGWLAGLLLPAFSSTCMPPALNPVTRPMRGKPPASAWGRGSCFECSPSLMVPSVCNFPITLPLLPSCSDSGTIPSWLHDGELGFVRRVLVSG
jgi:hypothetical protein